MAEESIDLPDEDEVELNVDDDKPTNGDQTSPGDDENTSGATGDAEEKELDELKRKVQQMQEEAVRLEEIQKQVEEQMNATTPGLANSKDLDARSVYVGNVDYGATPEELQAHFQSCGAINRVTILCDKFTGHPKGFAYVEFADEESVANSLVMNETIFRSRQIKVSPKRTNVPGYNRGWPQRAGFRGRGGFRGGRRRAAMYHPYM